MNYVLGKRIFNILNRVIFPAKIQISKPIDVSVFMFDLRMINMSSECEYDWYWKMPVCSTEYEVCDSFASLTRQQTWYSGSACWYFRYHINSHPDNIYIQWPDGKGQTMNYNSQHKTLKIRRISQNHTLI